MPQRHWIVMTALTILGIAVSASNRSIAARAGGAVQEAKQQREARLKWWREARFGLFIHWGLYAIPAGQWKDGTRHAEWIRHTAQIPIAEYDKFVGQFNPVNFDADQWVRIAKDAGMKYIVITSKHHDGFCLFDSKHTDYDVMSTPFKRDIMKELAEACRRAGLRICWYHSIMDWHHPDYLPRRDWEQRSEEGADLNRYVAHLKSQVGELLTNYGPIGVMWFDGEWEGTWTHEHGLGLFNYVRSIQPRTIVNNRVDKGRAGMAGMTVDARFAGDFGTPEQEIPPTGLPGVDWETCMTMNDHWGYNQHDHNWKSSEDLIRKLVDIASKGGNFLLNVGPTAAGTFPQESIDRLRDMGRWMEINGEAIYGTQASPFRSLPWGRCTQKALPDGDTRLYLHVFDWPTDEALIVPGVFNRPKQAYTLAATGRRPLLVERDEDALVVRLAAQAPDPIDSVIVLDVVGRPDVNDPPVIKAESDIFVEALDVSIESDRENVDIRYTTDGSEPTVDSPLVSGRIRLAQTATVTARLFRDGKPISPAAKATFTKVAPRPAVVVEDVTSGLDYEYYEGDWNQLPNFDQLATIKSGTVPNFDFEPRRQGEYFAFRYRGFVEVPRNGVYQFYTVSDDGSRLYIGQQLVVDNDGLHGVVEKSGQIALAAGLHPIIVTFFEKSGGDMLEVWYAGPGIEKQRIPNAVLRRPKQTSPGAAAPAPSPESLAKPTPPQLAWHDCELGMFIHFAPNTWTDREYDDLSLPLEEYNPTGLDTDQWVAAAEALGAKYIVFVAKHAGGFCLWQTDTTDYSIKSTPWRGGKGDILADLAQSCRKRGMKLGVYVSPADRKHGAGVGGRCKTSQQQEAYNKLYRQQLTEVLSRYGEMFEVWFDGSIVVPVGDILEKHAPNAMVFQGPHATIRWVGNEDGHAPYPAWNAVSETDARSGVATAKHGDPDGAVWLPNECDARIRNTWFWRTDNADTLKSVEQLMDMYYRSVGHGAVLLLNQTPDTTGLIPAADFQRGAEFGAEIKRRFGTPIAETAGEGAVVELPLDKPTTIDHVITMEDIAHGERVREYVIEVLADGSWKPICRGTAIGHKKIDRFSPVTVSRVRLRTPHSAAKPLVRKLAAYYTGPTAGSAAR